MNDNKKRPRNTEIDRIDEQDRRVEQYKCKVRVQALHKWFYYNFVIGQK